MVGPIIPQAEQGMEDMEVKGWGLARDHRLPSLPGSVPTHHWIKTGKRVCPYMPTVHATVNQRKLHFCRQWDILDDIQNCTLRTGLQSAVDAP